MNYYTLCNGFARELKADNLDDAFVKADENATYFQRNIYLYEREEPINYEEDGWGSDLADELGHRKPSYTRTWYGVKFDPETDCDEAEIIDFGDNGFYGPWEEV